jgi:hypothetical protein
MKCWVAVVDFDVGGSAEMFVVAESLEEAKSLLEDQLAGKVTEGTVKEAHPGCFGSVWE